MSHKCGRLFLAGQYFLEIYQTKPNQTVPDRFSLFFFSFLGFHFLRPPSASQQAHPAAVHGQPRAVHAPPQARQHRGPADEGSGQR